MKRFISSIKGHKITNKLVADLEKLERKLQDVYNSAETKAPTENGGVKYSAANNNLVVDISDDTELAERIGDAKTNEKQKIISKYILDLLRGQKIALSDGKIVLVDKSDADHIGHNANAKKVAAVSQITILLKNAKLVAEEESTKDKKFDYFYYYEAKVKYRNDIMSLYLNVGNTRNKSGYRLYDITEKLRDTARRLNGVDRLSKSFGLETVSLDNSIYKNDAKSQEKVSETDSEYLNLAKSPEKNEAKLRKMVDDAATNWEAIEKSKKPRILYHRTNANTSLDSQWQEWSELYPGLFDRETNSANSI